MSYDLKLTKTALKVYEKLPAKLQAGLNRCFAHLDSDPRNNPNVKKLKGYHLDHRYQMGGWRILYEVDDIKRTVTVYDVRPRGDAY